MTERGNVRAALEQLDATFAEPEIARQRARTVSLLTERGARPWSKRWALWVPAFVALTAGGILWLRAERRADLAAEAGSLRLESAEHSSGSVELAPGAQARLGEHTSGVSRRLGVAQYQVSLEKGHIEFDIDPQRHSSWSVVAGDFEVQVVGTVFAVDRDTGGRRFALAVKRGRVRVTGKGLSTPIFVEAGQALMADAQGIHLPSPAQLPPQPEPKTETAAPATPSSSAAGAEPPAVPAIRPKEALPTDWESLAQHHRYADALAAARARGLSDLAASLDVQRLTSLAQAARLAGGPGETEMLLLAVRRRFPATNSAHEAAFLLGRLQSDASGNPGAAAQWFQTYLKEEPSGSFAQEARGRRLLSLQQASSAAETRQAAADYLSHHPGGPYSARARQLLQ